MTGELVTVTKRVRGVVDGKVVVRRPGQLISRELAEQLGVAEPRPSGPPQAPAGARRPKPKAAKKPTRRKG